MTDRPPEPRKPWNLDAIAIALISVGALVVMLCGSCTGYFVGPALWTMITHPGAGGTSGEGSLAMIILIMAGLAGGLPTAGGVVLLMVGIGRARRGKPKPPPSSGPPPR